MVDEIRAAGGEAVANTDSVADAASAAAHHRDARVDASAASTCVVNNAGILRDRFFHKMSLDEWDAVLKVHLYGSFYMSRAAAKHLKEQAAARFVHMTSTSGLIGNFGQANYTAAKLGIDGAVEVHRARHAEVQRALELHRALRLEPHDRLHPDRHAARAGARGQHASR